MTRYLWQPLVVKGEMGPTGCRVLSLLLCSGKALEHKPRVFNALRKLDTFMQRLCF